MQTRKYLKVYLIADSGLCKNDKIPCNTTCARQSSSLVLQNMHWCNLVKTITAENYIHFIYRNSKTMPFITPQIVKSYYFQTTQFISTLVSSSAGFNFCIFDLL